MVPVPCIHTLSSSLKSRLIVRLAPFNMLLPQALPRASSCFSQISTCGAMQEVVLIYALAGTIVQAAAAMHELLAW